MKSNYFVILAALAYIAVVRTAEDSIDQHEGYYFLVYILGGSLGIYLRQGGYIDAFTAASILDNHEGGGVHLGDRIVAINDREIKPDASVDTIVDMIALLSPPYALTIAMNVTTAAERWASLEARLRPSTAHTSLSPKDSQHNSDLAAHHMLVVEPETRHHQDQVREEMGLGLDIDRYVPVSSTAIAGVGRKERTSSSSSSSSTIASSLPSSSSSKLSLFPDPEIWPQCIEGASINLVLGTLLLFTKQKSLTRYYYQYITIQY